MYRSICSILTIGFLSFCFGQGVDQEVAAIPKRTLHSASSEMSDEEVIRFAQTLAKFQTMPTDEHLAAPVPGLDKSLYLQIHINIPELNIVRASALLFPAYGTAIQDEYLPWLEYLAQVLNDHPRAVLHIDAHTDSIGTFDENQVLSDLRALEVKKFLMDKGLEDHRLKAKGWGELHPVADNSTKEGRQRNRRVELSTYFPLKRPISSNN